MIDQQYITFNTAAKTILNANRNIQTYEYIIMITGCCHSEKSKTYTNLRLIKNFWLTCGNVCTKLQAHGDVKNSKRLMQYAPFYVI